MMDEEIPIGVWIRMQLPDTPRFVGFTYVDPEAGYSVKGGSEEDPNLADSIQLTARLPLHGIAWEQLDEEAINRLHLLPQPRWLDSYGPQPEVGSFWGQWRHHPALQGKFHPEFPDDVQVYVHDGGPRLSDRFPEHIWVKIMGLETYPFGDVYRAVALNQPHQLTTVSLRQAIRFVVPAGFPYAIMVTDKYLAERADWKMYMCPYCGLSELFDAPSDLHRKAFSHVPQENTVVQSFTTFCPSCAGGTVLSRREKPDDPYIAKLDVQVEARVPFGTPFQLKSTPLKSTQRKWWQFWR